MCHSHGTCPIWDTLSGTHGHAPYPADSLAGSSRLCQPALMNLPSISDVIHWLDLTLDPNRRDDYGPNGLQVDASPEGQTLKDQACKRIVTGVTSNIAFLERAASSGADLAVVHHGLYWNGSPSTATGTLGRRIALCMRRGLSLAAYHLPLDAHLEFGNAAGLAMALGLVELSPAFVSKGQALGIQGRSDPPLSTDEFRTRLGRISDRTVLFEGGPDPIATAGIVTGGAPRLASEAASLGLHAYISGEVSEYSQAMAFEEGLHVAGCGHHRTEVFGPRLLAARLKEAFPAISVEFIDVDNPA